MNRILIIAASVVLLARPAFAALDVHDFSSLGTDPCSYCHSVHHGVGGLGRPAYFGPAPDVLKVYSSASMDHKIDINTVNKSDAPLCLTCHDATNVAAVNAGGGNLPTGATTGNANITTDLSNDHPVGFVFNKNLDSDLRDPVRAQVRFGPGRNEMWCSTCHNPHDNQYPPFLIMSNAASALCLDCHVK